MEQVALAITAIIVLFWPFGVKISNNDKTMINVIIHVGTRVMLT
jgi:hypothetical protein